MAAFNFDGKVVAVNDRVTIIGTVVSVTGSGGLATVVVETPLTTATISCKANDCGSVDHPNDATHQATNLWGKHFGVAGNAVSVLGVVTAISGTGGIASLTVTLKTSGASITVPAGAVRSVPFNG